MGHPSDIVLKRTLKELNVSFNKDKTFFCSSYTKAKMHKFPFSSPKTVYTAPLQMVHTDLWGPALMCLPKDFFTTLFLLMLIQGILGCTY